MAQAAPTILGVDPGARETGLTLTESDRVLDFRIVVAPDTLDTDNPIDVAYVRQVIVELEELLGETVAGSDTGDLDAIAIEAVKPPNPHLGMTNVAGALGLSAVAGGLIAWAAARGIKVLLIVPEGHGSSLLAAYPLELQPTSGQGKGTDIKRHARSAYDVALAARWYLKLEEGKAKAASKS